MDISNLTLQNAHLFLEEFDAKHNPIIEYDFSKCEECHGEMIIYNFFWTCSSCGLTDFDRLDVVLESGVYIPKKSMYKRRLYCLEKLKLMNCHKLSKSPKYRDMITDLKGYQDTFDTVFELKKLMKELKYNKFYKYIYSVYLDIKCVKLIDLRWNDMDKISDDFVKLEWNFRDSRGKQHMRKNMLSYSTLIYVIMKHHGYPCHKYVLLPQNHKQVEESIKLFQVPV